MSGNSLRQTVHTHCVSVHQAAKLAAALLRVAGVTAGLAESNGSLTPGLWLTLPAGWLPRTGISSGTLRSVIEYGLPLPFYMYLSCVSADECSSLWWLCTSPLDLLLRQTGSIKRCSQHMNETELDPNSEHVYCIGTVHVGGRSRTLRFSSVQFCSCTVNAPLLNRRLDCLQMTVDWQHRCKNVFNVFLIFQTFFYLKNVGKVQSGKQINKKHFQNCSNEIQWVHK